MWKQKFPSEQAALDSGEFIMHSCHNAIPVKAVYCPFCKKYNTQTDVVCKSCGQKRTPDDCPECGKPLKASALNKLKDKLKEAEKAEEVSS